MKKIVLLFFLLALLSGCGGNKKGGSSKTENNRSDIRTSEIHSTNYCGVYKGTLPAASSPGINTILTLNPDKTFTLHSEYFEEKEGIFDEKGTYTVDNNLLTTKSADGHLSYYKIEKGRLKMLNQNKQEVSGDLAKYYILNKEQ